MLWVNALRMVVVPLVVSAIFVAINALPEARLVGRIGGRAIALFVTALLGAAVYAVAVGSVVFALLDIEPAASAALRAGIADASRETVRSAETIVTVRQWLGDLVPGNPIRAAVDGAMLPLVVFAIVFALAFTRVAVEPRATVIAAARAVLDACLVVVRWVLVATPVAVFLLAIALAAKLGLAAAGAVGFYVVVASALCAGAIALLYVVAWVVGRVQPALFARACGPAQVVAFSTRSSLVALPALLEGAEKWLQLPVAIRSFLLPLAATTFRVGSAVGIPAGVLFMARLYGLEVGIPQLAAIALVSVVVTFSVPGIPGGSIIVMVPVLMAAGLPVEGIGLLLGVDTIPDMFRTTANTTGQMTAATILSRLEGGGART